MGKQVAFSLEGAVQNANNEKVILIKKGQDDLLGKSFGEILDYMTNAEEDDFNKAYTAKEQEVAGYISDLLENANKDPNIKVNLIARKKPDESGNRDFERVVITDKISDYNDSIIYEWTHKMDGGAEQKYDRIDLIVSTKTVGGTYKK